MSAKTNIAKLPEWCYSVLLTDNSLILIQAGCSGYSRALRVPSGYVRDAEAKFKVPTVTNDQLADFMNERKGITRAQREAMEIGSMFGWDVPGADMDTYNEDGSPKKENP